MFMLCDFYIVGYEFFCIVHCMSTYCKHVRLSRGN